MDPSTPAGSPGIEIQVNGEARRLPEGATVADLLRALGLPRQGVAVERNGEVVPRRRHAEVRLQPGDRLEVVGLVGGG